MAETKFSQKKEQPSEMLGVATLDFCPRSLFHRSHLLYFPNLSFWLVSVGGGAVGGKDGKCAPKKVKRPEFKQGKR